MLSLRTAFRPDPAQHHDVGCSMAVDVGLNLLTAHLSASKPEMSVVGLYQWGVRSANRDVAGPSRRIGDSRLRMASLSPVRARSASGFDAQGSRALQPPSWGRRRASSCSRRLSSPSSTPARAPRCWSASRKPGVRGKRERSCRSLQARRGALGIAFGRETITYNIVQQHREDRGP